MSYKEIYLNAIENNDKAEITNRINEVAYEMMMRLENPELFEILCAVNPTSDIRVIFLEDGEDINFMWDTPADMREELKTNPYPLDFSKTLLIWWDGICETVDEIKDLSLGWDDVFDSAVEDVLWDYINPSENCEMIELFEELCPISERRVTLDLVWSQVDELLAALGHIKAISDDDRWKELYRVIDEQLTAFDISQGYEE